MKLLYETFFDISNNFGDKKQKLYKNIKNKYFILYNLNYYIF